MKISTSFKLAALAALALCATCAPKAFAVPPNNWTLVGTSPGGGFIIVGSNPGDLGPLGPGTAPVHVSAGGFDLITENAGETATATGDTVTILNNTLFTNSGTIVSTAGDGVRLNNTNNIFNNWGSVTGSSVGVWSDDQHNTINNWGTITSSSAGQGVHFDDSFDTLNNRGVISGGQYGVWSDDTNNTINNWNTITASDGRGVYLNDTFNVVNNWGTIAGTAYGVYSNDQNNTINNYLGATISGGTDTGIYLDDTFNVVNNWGSITGPLEGVDSEDDNNTVNNWGTIATGVNGEGVLLDSTQDVLNNWGTIIGGVYGVDSDDTHQTINNWGSITATNGAGIYINEHFTVLSNWGTIAGSQYGVRLNDRNITINNLGTISTPSSGIYAFYMDSNSYHDNVLNNWGMITSNGGATAIRVENHDSTLNLNGHSSVVGKIMLTDPTNVVNLNFTGVNVALLRTLTPSLTAQGVNSGVATPLVVFTLRNVTYNIDPGIVNMNLKSYQLQGLTANQQAVGASLDSALVNPAPGTPLFNLFNLIDQSGNVPAILDLLSPQKYQLYGDLAIENATSLTLEIDERLNNLSGGSESIDTLGMGGTTTAGFSKDESKESKGVVQTAPDEKRWGFFASGNGNFYRANARDVTLQDTKATTAGAVMGIDGKVGGNAVIGLLAAYNRTDADLDTQGSHVDITSYTGGIYGSYHNGGYYLNSLATYTRNSYDSRRNLALPGAAGIASASTDGNQYSADIDGGYDFKVTDRFTTGPIAGLQYVHVDVDGFTEANGGAANLTVADQSIDSLQSRLGARADYHLQLDKDLAFALDVRAAWVHEFLNDSQSISANFAGSGLAPFSVSTSAPRRDTALVGLGVNFTLHDRVTFFADYDLQVGSSSYMDSSIKGGFRIAW